MPAFPSNTTPPMTRNTTQQQDLLRAFATRYIWWGTIEEALLFPERILAQVMNLGTFDDLVRLSNAWTSDELRHVITHAEPGWFDERSWTFWHLRLGLTAGDEPPPPLPIRTFPD